MLLYGVFCVGEYLATDHKVIKTEYCRVNDINLGEENFQKDFF